MKTIFQKHSSKFVVSLFNSLGIIACVSLTSCGGKNKGKQTENQGENLKNDLLSKGLKADDAKVIAEWLEENKKDISGLKEEDLKEIFKDDPSKLQEVADKLGVKLTESDPQPNPDYEKHKEINEWLAKLDSLEDDEFNKLDEVLKEKVAQKFIDNGIDVENADDIKAKLAGFINEVVVKKKESEITLKIQKGGKVTIVKVADNTTEFDFDSLEKLQGFVDALNGKDITKIEGDWSLIFDKNKVKICGHGTGFDYIDKFDDFFHCFEVLTNFNALKVPNLSLKIGEGKLYLNEVECTDDLFKGEEFWKQVKDHTALFDISDQFEIVKKGTGEDATVKIENFESSLKWSDVVEGENTLKKDSGWDKIFKLKNEEPKPEATKPEATKTEVKIEWNKKNGYKLGDEEEFIKINSLENLENLIDQLKDKTVKEINGNFTLAFSDSNVNICGGDNIDITSGENFETLLGYVTTLKDTHKAIRNDFKIKIKINKNSIKLNRDTVSANFIANSTFWDAVKNHKDLFDGLPINVVRDSTENSNKGKIGKTVIMVDIFSEDDIAEDWKEIFKKN